MILLFSICPGLEDDLIRDERLAEPFDQTPRLGRRPGVRADPLTDGKRQLLAVCRTILSRSKTLMTSRPEVGAL